MSIIYSVLLLIDGVIYDFICYIYEIFYSLADINIFSDTAYKEITTKLYVILGLVMMFVLAYSLLKAVINPDDYAKGEQSITKLIPNVLVSLAIIVLLPTVFEFAMNFQHAVLTNNTIYNFFLDENEVNSASTTVEPGRETAFYTFSAFFYPSEEFCSSDEGGNTTDINACKEKVLSNGDKWYWPPSWGNKEISLAQLDSSILSGEASFRNYTQFSDAVAENEASYTLIVSTVAGVFILYVLLNFCFDMAVRVIKLAFYQLIAPIPVICRILPGGKFKDTFNTWVKQTVSVYLEVFIRIFVMAISVFLIDFVVRYFDSGELTAQIGNVGFVQRLIIQALLIMAVVIFMKQAPKLIGDLFKLDTGGMKLGLMDKLAMGGGLLAGAAAGGLVTTGARNFTNAFTGKGIIKDFRNKNFSSAFKKIGTATLSGSKSAFGGAVSGGVRAGFAARNAKNFKDAQSATRKGIGDAIASRDKRASYKASHSVSKDKLGALGKIPVIGSAAAGAATTGSVLMGHAGDSVGRFGRYIGIGNIDALKAENAAMSEITGAEDAFNNEFESTLLKSINKGKSNLAGASLVDFRDKKEALDLARLKGQGVSTAEKEYKDAIKDVQKSLHNKLYSSQANWNALSEDDQVALGQLRVKATEYRGAIMNNASLDALKEAGINGSDFAMNKDIPGSVFYDAPDGTKSVVSKMGDKIKLHTASNDVNISAMKQKNTDEKKK